MIRTSRASCTGSWSASGARSEGEPTRASFLAAVQKQRVFDLGGIEVAFGPEDHQGMDEVFLTVFEGGEVRPLN